MSIIKDELHPVSNPADTIYPKTSWDMVQNRPNKVMRHFSIKGNSTTEQIMLDMIDDANTLPNNPIALSYLYDHLKDGQEMIATGFIYVGHNCQVYKLVKDENTNSIIVYYYDIVNGTITINNSSLQSTSTAYTVYYKDETIISSVN